MISFELPCEKFRDKAMEYMKQWHSGGTGLSKKFRERKQIQQEEAWDYVKQEQVQIVFFEIMDRKGLLRLLPENVGKETEIAWKDGAKGILYFIAVQEKPKTNKNTVLDYYLELWYSAIIMAVREWLHEKIKSRGYKTVCSLAPGVDPIPMEQLEEWTFCANELAGKTVCQMNHGVLTPENSILALFLFQTCISQNVP